MENDAGSKAAPTSRLPLASLKWFASANRKKLIVVGVVVFAALGALVGGVWCLRNYVRGIDRYQVYRDTLAPDHFPAWVNADIRKELMDLPGVPEKFSLLDPGICRTIARAYQANPWVAQVLAVEKKFPNHLLVQLKLRRPIVAVKVNQFYFLTDAQGCRLSPPLKQWPVAGIDVPVVLASDVRVLPERGRPWQDFGPLSGVAVQTYLDKADLKTHIAVIDLKNLKGRLDRRQSEILLWTDQHSCIYWGRSPLEPDSPGELSPLDKISKMEDFERRHGPLGLYRYVKIQYDEVYVGPRIQPSDLQASGPGSSRPPL